MVPRNTAKEMCNVMNLDMNGSLLKNSVIVITNLFKLGKNIEIVKASAMASNTVPRDVDMTHKYASKYVSQMFL